MNLFNFKIIEFLDSFEFSIFINNLIVSEGFQFIYFENLNSCEKIIGKY